MSPFTEVQIRGDDVDVKFNDNSYELVSIDDLPTAKIVEVLEGMGRRPGDTVKLVLRDRARGKEHVIRDAPMTRENRQAAYAARYGTSAPREAQGASLKDDRAIRELISQFMSAAESGDTQAVSQLLAQRRRAEGPRRAAIDAGEAQRVRQVMLRSGLKPDNVRSITVRGDRAMAVSDFFSVERQGMHCVVYFCQREAGEWRIDDIDAEAVEGLVKEVGRFVKPAVAGEKK